MTTLNEAEKIRFGNDIVSRVYSGSQLIWPSPKSLPGLALWIDADQLDLADGAPVLSWPNLVDNVSPLSLMSYPAPVKRANALNGRSVVRFTDGQGGFKQTSFTGVDRDCTFFIVGRMWGANRKRIVSGDINVVNMLVGWHGGLENVAYMEGWFSGYPGPAATTNWKLYSLDGISPYTAEVLADVPIVYYRMNEVLGTEAKDSSGNNRHGLYSNSPIFSQRSPVGTGLRFNGTNHAVYFPASVTIPVNSSITVEWWQYVATADVAQSSAFTIGDNAPAPSNFVNCHAPWVDKSIYWDYGTQTNGRIATPYTAQLDKWTLIHLTYNAATGKRAISFDGVEVVSRVDSSAPTAIRIGGNISGYQGAKIVDEFAIYTTELTAARRLAHFNARVPTFRLFGNGTLLGTGGTAGWANTFTINEYPTERSDAEVAEAILYNRKLSDVERQLIEAYLRSKWGIT